MSIKAICNADGSKINTGLITGRTISISWTSTLTDGNFAKAHKSLIDYDNLNQTLAVWQKDSLLSE